MKIEIFSSVFHKLSLTQTAYIVKTDLRNTHLKGELLAIIEWDSHLGRSHKYVGGVFCHPSPRSSAFFQKNMAAKIPIFTSLFTISFNSLPIVCENYRNMLEQTVY